MKNLASGREYQRLSWSKNFKIANLRQKEI
jgi:hypothetical protein